MKKKLRSSIMSKRNAKRWGWHEEGEATIGIYELEITFLQFKIDITLETYN